MSDPAYRSPSTTEKSFNCPHCGALAKQHWYETRARQLDKDRLPIAFTEEQANDFGNGIDSPDAARDLREWANRVRMGIPFFSDSSTDPYSLDLYNVYASECYNCNDLSIWIGNRLAYPALIRTHRPNADLPEEIKKDYLEAATILDASPRGAAALLRLAIQKLCKHLGEEGKNINSDIAALVTKGLDPRVKKALDVVRVVGNNAVHPGQIDLSDDSSSAERLFGLVNLIADIMISQPKHVDEIFQTLPDSAKAAIERRDGK